ncbi:MAG: trypsin-like peptidase domain-containing protein [Oscillospiraceae bacterium]|jgi:serine protease Do|nr:trypsin-like peptidase domain-containing protein [Oscillospiraceae bacterium]MCI1990510.1 trypsin-like peptidase domain-containing protein [Oscillospiraceae bacterium]MCI2034634.1 trypsin-like peptidase domain-containing protein [Oscillospiraceae bacterium]
MSDPNDNNRNNPKESGGPNDQNRERNSGAIWQGNTYRSYRDPGAQQDDSYGAYGQSYVEAVPVEPRKKKHTFRKVLAGVLACLIVSAGSIAGFAALINNGTIRIQSAGPDAAFTIVKNSSSSSSAPVANTATTSELTKQQVAKKVVPSVVCIQNYSSSAQQSTGQNGSGNGYGFGYFEEGGDGSDNGSGNGSNRSDGSDDGNSGSGVSPTSEGSGIIATSDGYIITNAHVVSGSSALKVVLSTGKTYQAKLIGSDSITDLALIKIDATGLTAAEFGSSDDLQVADAVLAIGNPGGMEFNSSVTVGYISALNREITSSDTGYTMKCIQTDAAINPGNSGGALVNMKGQVVGVNSSKIVATGYEGLGFAIPINTVQPIISELKQYGYVKDRAVLGVSGQYIDSMTARFYGLSSGLYIGSVSSSYVSAAGIQKGDVITKIDNKSVTSRNTITSAIASKKPGDTVTLTVSRSSSGQTFTASVKLSQATGKS